MRELKERPQKDGISTEYKCGVLFTGGWATRLKKHAEFCGTKEGKYIMQLEQKCKELEEALKECTGELYSIHSQYGDKQHARHSSYALTIAEKALNHKP